MKEKVVSIVETGTAAEGVRAEDDLLLSCLGVGTQASGAERRRSLARQSIDWTYLIEAAQRHGVMPLLYCSLRDTCADAAPAPVLDRLHGLFRNNKERNLFLTGELFRLLGLLEARQIRAVAFKGPALASSVYGDIALRQFSDLDILIDRRDLPKARDVLISLGYEPKIHLAGAEEKAFLRTQCDLFFTRPDKRIFVELAWGVVPRYFRVALTTPRIWRGDPPATTGDDALSTLPPEEHLLALCVHATKHLWERLVWVCDVANLVRVYEGLDWKYAFELAGRLRIRRILLLGLRLAEDLLGASLPEEARREMEADPRVHGLASYVRRRLFRPICDLPPSREVWRFHRLVREHPADRLLYCVDRALTPSPADWAALPLPDVLFPLHYLFRPLRLLGTHAFGLVGRPLRRKRRAETGAP